MKKSVILVLCLLVGCTQVQKEEIVEKKVVPIEEIIEVDDFYENCPAPYEGMKEVHMSETLCGPYAKKEEDVVGKNIYHKYIWYAKNQKDIPLIVRCNKGKVEKVHRYFLNPKSTCYWKEDGTPDFDHIPEKISYQETSDYDVEDYDNPDDFYEDHESDFEDYEEAEDYWYDWH